MPRSVQLTQDSLGADYIGLVDIFLQPSDTPLSGPSLTKALNVISNDVMRTILIGHGPSIEAMAGSFDTFRSFIDEIESPDSESARVSKVDALAYLSEVENVVTGNQALTQPNIENAVCAQGYNTLVSTLQQAGCVFREGCRECVRPSNSNICLSMMDASGSGGGDEGRASTLTSTLNEMSNWVVRTMLYGGSSDRVAMADILARDRGAVVQRWVGGDELSQASKVSLFLSILLVYCEPQLTYVLTYVLTYLLTHSLATDTTPTTHHHSTHHSLVPASTRALSATRRHGSSNCREAQGA